jgi:hypothetical protein
VRKPGVQDYGVELACPADGARMQVQIVGSDQPVAARSATRDRDQEVIWCSEFADLKNLVAQSGSKLVLERAIEAGAQGVKTVHLPAGADETGRTAKIPSARVLG